MIRKNPLSRIVCYGQILDKTSIFPYFVKRKSHLFAKIKSEKTKINWKRKTKKIARKSNILVDGMLLIYTYIINRY